MTPRRGNRTVNQRPTEPPATTRVCPPPETARHRMPCGSRLEVPPPLPSRARERGGIQNLIDLRVGEDVLLSHQLENALTRLQCFRRELRGLVVPDDRV